MQHEHDGAGGIFERVPEKEIVSRKKEGAGKIGGILPAV